MGPNPNAVFCGFLSGLAQVTVQVATSIPLSRHHPCRDIDLTSRHQLKSAAFTDVATSISCRDISSWYCNFELVSLDVATLISCRDITSWLRSFQLKSSLCHDISIKSLQLSTDDQWCHDITLCLCRFQLVAHDVATSISYRDNNLKNYKLQLIALGVATSISCRDITLWLCTFHLMVPDVATSISCREISSKNCNLQLFTSGVATSVFCRDINLCLWRLH